MKLKKAVCVFLVFLIACSFSACQWVEDTVGVFVIMMSIWSSDDSVPKEDIIEFVNEHQSELKNCEASGDFSSFEGLGIVKNVSEHHNCIDFYCGGKGMAAGYSYYCGFFYSPDCDRNALRQGDKYNSEEIFEHYYFYEIEYY